MVWNNDQEDVLLVRLVSFKNFPIVDGANHVSHKYKYQSKVSSAREEECQHPVLGSVLGENVRR